MFFEEKAMGIGLGFGPALTPRLILECLHCQQSISEHAENCPMGEFEEAKHSFLNYQCPSCKNPVVELNTSDYFECRSCHRQFTRGAGGDNGQPTQFLDFWGEMILVVELPEFGEGDIPILRVFEAASRKLELAEDALRKRRRSRRRVSPKP
jgi:ribosomal protein S27E